jgi:ParB family chromosome partitioning protein
MVRSEGHIELDRAIESIQVGYRVRRDMGDLEGLAASIDEFGLLQPLTVTPEGLLICGARRLEAAKRLGMRQVNVWVRSGISTPLQLLMAEQTEDTMHKPLLPTEAAALYRELKELLAEESRRRMQETQFGKVAEITGISGSANLAEPSERTARAQAAQLVTGRKSYTTLERVGEIERFVAAPDAPPELREVASTALARIDVDGKVNGHYQQVKAALAESRNGELTNLAQTALARVQAERRASGKRRIPRGPASLPSPAKKYSLRAFLLTWDEMADWTVHYDPDEIGRALNAEQWAQFESTIAATLNFVDKVRTARESRERSAS